MQINQRVSEAESPCILSDFLPHSTTTHHLQTQNRKLKKNAGQCDIILFGIGRKSIGFSEKNLSPLSPLSPHKSIPSASISGFSHYSCVGTHRYAFQSKVKYFTNARLGKPAISQCLLLDSSGCSRFVVHTARVGESYESILEFSYMRIILIWPPYNTFLSKGQGFFAPFFQVFFLTIRVQPPILAM